MDKPMNKDGVSLCSHGGTCAENMIEHGGAFCASPPVSTDGLVERAADALRNVPAMYHVAIGDMPERRLAAIALEASGVVATLADRDATIEVQKAALIMMPDEIEVFRIMQATGGPRGEMAKAVGKRIEQIRKAALDASATGMVAGEEK